MEMSTPLPMDNPFWQFSLRVYAVREAAAECLALQRVRAVNVNILLFSSWIAVSRNIALNAADIELIESEIDNWHALAVLPLREIRDRLKLSTEMQHQEVQALRRQVLASESYAERIEQALIFQRAEGLSLRQGTGEIRDILTGNIDLLCSRAPLPDSRETPVSVSALIEASLAMTSA